MDRATAAFAEFRSRWPSAQPLFAKYASDALDPATGALERATAAMTAPGTQTVPAIDALLASYNNGVSAVNNAARAAGYQTN